ncbi:MAG: hypothetical protein HFG86_00840 [Dorea sp.]|nr:hypothetical protein [Dorea sp.]
MRINTQNIFWMNTSHTQKALNRFLPGAVRSAEQHREISEKAALLTKGAGTRGAETGIENAGPAALSSFIVAKQDIPAKAALKIETYYQTVGSLTDSVTYKEERLKYLQSEYEKMSVNRSEKHLQKMKELIDSEYRDMEAILNSAAKRMNVSLHNSEAVYGKEFSEEYRALFGDIPDRLGGIAAGLRDTGSVKEALQYLAAAKASLGGLAEDLRGMYQKYTGKELAEYEYHSGEDFAESVRSYGLIWSWDEVTVDTKNTANLSDYGVDINNLSAIPEAVNLIDTKA